LTSAPGTKDPPQARRKQVDLGPAKDPASYYIGIVQPGPAVVIADGATASAGDLIN
jgi:hypothetical protein